MTTCHWSSFQNYTPSASGGPPVTDQYGLIFSALCCPHIHLLCPLAAQHYNCLAVLVCAFPFSQTSVSFFLLSTILSLSPPHWPRALFRKLPIRKNTIIFPSVNLATLPICTYSLPPFFQQLDESHCSAEDNPLPGAWMPPLSPAQGPWNLK